MNTENLNLFFRKMSEDAAMRNDFVHFAAKFDVDLSELNDAQLGDVSGGAGSTIVVTVPGGSVRTEK